MKPVYAHPGTEFESIEFLPLLLGSAEQHRDRLVGEIGRLRRSQPKPGHALLHRWTVENLLLRKHEELDSTHARIREYRQRLAAGLVHANAPRHIPEARPVAASLG